MLEKRWPWIAFVGLMLAIASLQVLLSSADSNNTLPTNIPNEVRPQATAPDLPESTALTPPDVATDPVTADSACELNKSVVFDNLTITFVDVIESSGSNRARPKAGHVFIQPLFRLENNSDHDFAISSVLSFSVYVDDKKTGESYLALQDLEARKLDGTIGPGKTLEGGLAIQAPEDWKQLEIRFRPRMQADLITFQCQNRR